MPQDYTYDPEAWLTSATRALKEYVADGFHNAILDDDQLPQGLTLWNIVMEFPPADAPYMTMPLEKNVVHFEIDVHEPHLLGFGDGVMRDNYDAVAHTVRPQEASRHVLNFDVGIWTVTDTGGTTARLQGYEILTNLLFGPTAKKRAWEATKGADTGLDIRNYRGGRFVIDRINDVPVFRMVGGELEVEVFSRTPIPPLSEAVPTVESFSQTPTLAVP